MVRRTNRSRPQSLLIPRAELHLEFSGLLYKELSRRIKQKNPLLAECFAHMARDEAAVQVSSTKP